MAQYFGEAPAQSKSCTASTLTAAAKAIKVAPDPNFCNEYHAAEPTFWKRVYYWITPVADCGNGESNCVDNNAWIQAWTDIKG